MVETGGSSVDWYDEIGAIVDDLGSERFGGRLAEGLHRLVPFELIAIFVYRGRARPLLLYDNFAPYGAEKGVATYIKGTYVLNPFYIAYLNGLGDGVYRLREMAPDAFFESEVFRQYDVSASPSEEIGYVTHHWPVDMEEINVAVSLRGKEMAEICLCRPRRDGGFSDDDLRRLATVRPAIAALLRKHWTEMRIDGERVAPPDSHVDDAFAEFGNSVLTDRECSVVRLILSGHSSKSIGSNLGISLGTVKTHRKNAYAKLAISSQSELLSLFLQSLKAL